MKFLFAAGYVVSMALITAQATATGAGIDTEHVQPVTVSSADGQVICNTSGAFAQIPGHPDEFVGRGYGIGSLDYCHKIRKPLGFLALFHMDWQQHTLTMGEILLKPPVKTSAGVELHNTYDPYVAEYQGTLWVAFECTSPNAVSSCIVPLDLQNKTLDLSRLSVPVEGTIGPHGANKQIVGLLSASAPTLLAYSGRLLLYWQVDAFDNQLRENPLVTRGGDLQLDSHGMLWIGGSAGHPVKTDDPQRTRLVHDVKQGDLNSDHVAVLSDAMIVDGKILEVASVGGTGGQQVCRSTHDVSPGCWRVALSVSKEPLGKNSFGEHRLELPELPANVIEYPRIITDPSGHHYLMGYFEEPKAQPLAERTKMSIKGLAYVPIQPQTLVR
jgi:hypothetical protein